MADDTIQLDTDRTSRQDAVKFFNITTSQALRSSAAVSFCPSQARARARDRRGMDWIG